MKGEYLSKLDILHNFDVKQIVHVRTRQTFSPNGGKIDNKLNTIDQNETNNLHQIEKKVAVYQ